MTVDDELDPAVLDALAMSLSPTLPGASLRDRLLDVVSTTGRFLPFVDRMMRLFDLPEARVREELATIDEDDAWEDLAPGVQFRDFEGGEGVGEAHGGLTRIEPGQVFPRHAHVGDEQLLVLQGELEDEDGTRYRAGDVVRSVDGSSHELRAVGSRETIYAALVIALSFEADDEDDDDEEDLEDFD